MPVVTFAETGSEDEVFNAILKHDAAKLREALNSLFATERISDFKPVAFEYPDLLRRAVKSNFREGIEILLRETNVNTLCGFIDACAKRDDDVILLFLQVACERRRCWSNYLYILMVYKYVTMAQEFIQLDGFNVDDQELYIAGRMLRCSEGRNGQSSLHLMTLFLEPQLLEHLINRGGKPDIRDADDYTPLYVACLKGSYECCQCLLRHGANPNINDTTKQDRAEIQRLPLYALCRLSVSSANEAIVGLLLSAGLDMTKHRWILDRRRRHNITDDTLSWLKSMCRVPTTLEIICVRAIRDHLSKLTTGRSILRRVQGLPVPLLMMARLVVSDTKSVV